ncbi:MAG: lipid-A-disaccharide synthase, partial [Pseudomonadota bacterium]
VTTELAINKTPTVVAYRADVLTAFWARRVVTSPFASIVNVAAGEAVMPEFIQEECAPEKLAPAVAALLSDEAQRAVQTARFDDVIARLGLDGPPAAGRAADQLLAWMAKA